MENKNFNKVIIFLVAQLVVISISLINMSKKRHHEYANMHLRD